MDEGHDAPTIALAQPHERHKPWPALMTGVTTFALILLISVGGFLFAPSDATAPQPPANVDSLPYVDGVLVVVELPDLVLDAYDPINGEQELSFKVREADSQYFDVVHLRAHSSIGLPTRLFYEEEGGQRWAVYKEDAPANSTTSK